MHDAALGSRRITLLVWWGLWVACVILLSIMFPLHGEGRINVPHGQYIYFAITLAVLIGFGVSLWQGNTELPPVNYLIFLLILFVSLLPSAVGGMNPLYSLRLITILLITTLPFILMGNLASSHAAAGFLGAFLFVSFVSALGALVLQWYGPVRLGAVELSNHLHGGWRWAFLFNQSTDLAATMALGVSTVLYLLVVTSRLTVRCLLLFLVLPLLLFVYWKTDSRGGVVWVLWALFVFGIAGLVSLYRRLGSPKWYWDAVLLVTLVAVGIGYLVVSDAIYHFLRLGGADITAGRQHVWWLYWDEFLAHPFIGFGFGGNAEFMADKPGISPFNVYFGLLGETGLIGAVPLFVFWLVGLSKALWVALLEWGIDRRRAGLALWVLAVLGGLALQQNGEWSILRIAPVNYLFFFTMSIAWSLDKYQIGNDKA